MYSYIYRCIFSGVSFRTLAFVLTFLPETREPLLRGEATVRVYAS